ncbi:MAG: hydrogen peroxide-inducible genes activator [Rhodothalassiaceae bacterium]
MPTLRQFEYLIAVAEEGHYGRAARKLGVTQPTLSHQLARLEDRFGQSLLDRQAKGVALTPFGRTVVDRARTILAQVADLHRLAAAAQGGLAGTLRLGVPPTLGPYLLPHLVPLLHKRYPDLKLYVRETQARQLTDGLASGVFDLVLAPLPLRGPLVDSEMLFREPLFVVAAPDHPLALRERIDRADLVGQQVLSLEPGHHLHEQVAHLCEEFGAELLRDYEGTSLDTLRQMVGMGVGIAFLPALYVRSEIAPRSDVAVLPLTRATPARTIGLAWRPGSSSRTAYADIAALIRRVIAEGFSEMTVLGGQALPDAAPAA